MRDWGFQVLIPQLRRRTKIEIHAKFIDEATFFLYKLIGTRLNVMNGILTVPVARNKLVKEKMQKQLLRSNNYINAYIFMSKSVNTIYKAF